MQRSLAKLINELLKTSRAATVEETATLVKALKDQDKQEKIQALVARLKVLRGS